MITSTIGRFFLDAYNERYGTSYDAKGFFEDVYFPLMFGGKYALWITNSPFVQGITTKSIDDWIVYGKQCAVAGGKKEFVPLDDAMRKAMLDEFMLKIEKGSADASVAVGYAAADDLQTTSGQITDMPIPTAADDLLLSWVGHSLGVCVQGGVSILFWDKDILLDIFKGWQYYRNALNTSPMLKGNQLNTWNGQWLAHCYKRSFDPANPKANFEYASTANNGIMSVDVANWIDVLARIALKYPDSKLMSYIYNLGQTNTTVGFIPFDLTQIRRPFQLYAKLFGQSSDRQEKLVALWGKTQYGFRAACKAGAIGLKALEPKGLRDYVSGDKSPKSDPSEKEQFNYDIYQTWILAMLNNNELWDASLKVAHMLQQAAVNKDKTLSTVQKNKVKEVLDATSKKKFIDAITGIVPVAQDLDALSGIVQEVHNMPTDNVPYFLTLVRFQYATLNYKQ